MVNFCRYTNLKIIIEIWGITKLTLKIPLKRTKIDFVIQCRRIGDSACI